MNWDDYKPRQLPYYKSLNKNTIVEFKIGYDIKLGIINKIMYPGYKYMNSNPWILRYELIDYFDGDNHKYLIDHNAIIRSIKINELKTILSSYVNGRQKTSEIIQSEYTNKSRSAEMEGISISEII